MRSELKRDTTNGGWLLDLQRRVVPATGRQELPLGAVSRVFHVAGTPGSLQGGRHTWRDAIAYLRRNSAPVRRGGGR